MLTYRNTRILLVRESAHVTTAIKGLRYKCGSVDLCSGLAFELVLILLVRSCGQSVAEDIDEAEDFLQYFVSMVKTRLITTDEETVRVR